MGINSAPKVADSEIFRRFFWTNSRQIGRKKSIIEVNYRNPMKTFASKLSLILLVSLYARFGSANVVGYYNLTIYSGDNLIANQLETTNNTLNFLLSSPSVPNGATFTEWDSVANAFLPASTYIMRHPTFGTSIMPLTLVREDACIRPRNGRTLLSARFISTQTSSPVLVPVICGNRIMPTGCISSPALIRSQAR